MSTEDAQKSEVHAVTADAESSPTSAGDAAFTRPAGVAARVPSGMPPETPSNKPATGPAGGVAPVSSGPVRDLHIIDDQTSVGGPLVIESSDPELNPPRVRVDPFPTERTPEIDPAVKK